MPPQKIKDSTIITPVPLHDALGERYLAYALSTITSRSLPDVRDGLKPVHRRLLYAMLQLKLDPSSGFKKCARVVGDVIGKYHPHGDTAVYDTLVRLAQEFAVRYPLVEGQGNFGSIDGDNAAAMRYTEARLTDVAIALLEDIDSDTVDFRQNYDGSEEEPTLLPARFPNLLANGSEGIAVGMATSIPPHNLDEICDALLFLIKKPQASVAELLPLIPGPDFPTGGILVEAPDSILKSYETGRGSFRLRARWEKEPLSHGLYQVIVTEMPYHVSKGRLIEKIAELFRDKKLMLLGNIRDESTDQIRLVLEPKNRQVTPELLMESLFKLTELEVRIPLNLNVLTANHTPHVLNLKQVLEAFLAHRHEVLIRHSKNRLGQIERRLEILAGFLIAYLNLDEVIRIIREEDDPKAKMMRKWNLSDTQVEAILNMRLRALRKLEEIEIRTEHDKLSAEKAELEDLLTDEKKQKDALAKEIKATKKQFGKQTKLGARRTELSSAPDVPDLPADAFIEKEPITVLCSRMGWIRAIKGHVEDLSNLKYKEGDEGRFALHAHTTDRLLTFTSDGKCFTLSCDKLPAGKGFGEPLGLLFDLATDSELIALEFYQPELQLLLASNNGRGFQIAAEDALAQTRSGKLLFNLAENSKLSHVLPVNKSLVAVIGENRKLLIFPAAEIPTLKRGGGVWLQRYQQGRLSDIQLLEKEEGIRWNSGSRILVETDLLPYMGNRAGSGKLAPRGFPRDNRFGEVPA